MLDGTRTDARPPASTGRSIGWGILPKRLWAGALLGWGGFQVYDGLFQHKVLGLHQIRYGVDILPYHLVWNVGGAIGIVLGIVLLSGPVRSVADPS